MKEKNRRININKVLQIILLILLLIYTFLAEILHITFTDNEIITYNLNMVISRTLGGLFVLSVIAEFGYKIFKFKDKKSFLKALLIIVLPLLVVINNLPIYALLTNNAKVTQPAVYVVLFGVACFATGFFEELLFRGLIFVYILKGRSCNVRGAFEAVLISSVIFGLSHVLNIFFGAGIGETLLQIGYSFLMGCMWSVLLLRTKNIWLCIILHSIYNFCGLLIPQMGQGILWDIPTVIITVILSIITALYILKLLLMTKSEDINFS